MVVLGACVASVGTDVACLRPTPVASVGSDEAVTYVAVNPVPVVAIYNAVWPDVGVERAPVCVAIVAVDGVLDDCVGALTGAAVDVTVLPVGADVDAVGVAIAPFVRLVLGACGVDVAANSVDADSTVTSPLGELGSARLTVYPGWILVLVTDVHSSRYAG
jgi:hypothetical protein